MPARSAFYLALAVGSSIQAAYDIGVQAVLTAPNMPQADESSSFLLLPEHAPHDVVVLPSLPRVEQWEPPAPLGKQRQPLPAPTEGFRGRNVEAYRVVSAILDRCATSPRPPEISHRALPVLQPCSRHRLDHTAGGS